MRIACGEHSPGPTIQAKLVGSSPRMRGTQVNAVAKSFYERFIPAHAGNTLARAGSGPGWPVHPRACGEHVLEILPDKGGGGSSPRMRGTRRARSVGTLSRRFIPAHAGNTRTPVALAAPVPVHPRACGEHHGGGAGFIPHPGSSPRMRGTRLFRSCPGSGCRFIPAHAGNT